MTIQEFKNTAQALLDNCQIQPTKEFAFYVGKKTLAAAKKAAKKGDKALSIRGKNVYMYDVRLIGI